MRAQAIAMDVPTVIADDTVATALGLLASQRVPGLVVVDAQHRPVTVLPGTQVLRMSIALGYQTDAALARAVDEAHADIFSRQQANRPIRECLPPDLPTPATVPVDATLLEVAGVMARAHCPLVAVVDRQGVLVGGVTLSSLLAQLEQAETAHGDSGNANAARPAETSN